MILKLIIIILVILIFLYFIIYQLEGFSNKNYTNSKVISCEYNNIYSHLPYDIISKDKNDKIYDIGNDELNEIFRNIFKIDISKVISLVDGINWSKWSYINDLNYSSNIYNYYSNVIEDFTIGLNHSSLFINGTKYNIISSNLNRYKTSLDNSNIYLLDINIIIYRPNRPLAKDIKIFAVCNGIYTNLLLVKVVGVIPECQLKSTQINQFDLNSYNNYSEFIPTEIINYDMNSFIYDTNDKLAKSQAEYNLYNKLLKDLT
jgi:hypothetical protein